jgi:hypothetical protein
MGRLVNSKCPNSYQFWLTETTVIVEDVIKENIKRRIEVTERRGRRRKQLLDDRMEKRGYWKLKEEALDRTVWSTRFGRGYGPVVRQATE